MANTTFTVLLRKLSTRTFVMLFYSFFKEIEENYRHTYKIEGVPHESNRDLIEYYKKRVKVK